MNLKQKIMEEKTIKERWKAKTPKFWKKVQRIGLVAGAVGAALLAAPIALPAAILTGAGYLVAVGGVTATLSQLTVDNHKTK
jgi:hypothetical protein